MTASDEFYDTIPIFRGFGSLMEPTLYQALPDDWVIGMADVVQSTLAIRADRYKDVNMAGAAVIAAAKNALKGRSFPYVFGGDGASFAVPPRYLALARDALAATAGWVRDDLGLAMRVALVPVRAVRAQGLDVKVARFAPSAHVTYAMFSGGGLRWADAAMKQGEFAVPPAPPGVRPDLSGLSCRFREIPAKRGVILSLVVLPASKATPAEFRAVIEDVIELVEQSPDHGRPVPLGGPMLQWPADGADLEAHAGFRSRWPFWLRKLLVLARTSVYFLILRFDIKLGTFEPVAYLRQVVENSDFRKFDDGLRMVLDCAIELADAIEGRLKKAAAAQTVYYGLHRQDAAIMTCITPSPTKSDHVHFVDGARGGYALAARDLKQMATQIEAGHSTGEQPVEALEKN